MSALSVVVTIVDGGAALERCLEALVAQTAAGLEVVVPWDASVAEAERLFDRFPSVRFVPLGAVAPTRLLASAAGRHELIDRRRASGLAAAGGEIVALVEDRGAPRAGWVAGVVSEHARLPHAAIGGAVELTAPSPLVWAVHLADFGRYRPPYAPGPRQCLTDVNVSYKRRALEATRHLWRERFHETTVHGHLQRTGETLYLSDRFAIEQRRDRPRIVPLLAERASSGRLFAVTRARELSRSHRWALAALCPALPLLLVARELRRRAGRGEAARPPRGTLAAMYGLAVAWSWGELLGYLTGAE